jgi:hypothetical protein
MVEFVLVAALGFGIYLAYVEREGENAHLVYLGGRALSRSRRSSCCFRGSGQATTRQDHHPEPKIESAGGQSEGDTFVSAEGAQSTEGAHMKCMSIFEIDEHLQALAPSRMRYSGGETKRRLA